MQIGHRYYKLCLFDEQDRLQHSRPIDFPLSQITIQLVLLRNFKWRPCEQDKTS